MEEPDEGEDLFIILISLMMGSISLGVGELIRMFNSTGPPGNKTVRILPIKAAKLEFGYKCCLKVLVVVGV